MATDSSKYQTKIVVAGCVINLATKPMVDVKFLHKAKPCGCIND